MNSNNILDGKPPSPININENKNNLTLEEENIILKNELIKLKKEYDIISKKIKIFENEVCCGCCGLRWAVTMN
jgi:hypothetical protein